MERERRARNGLPPGAAAPLDAVVDFVPSPAVAAAALSAAALGWSRRVDSEFN